MCTEDNGIGLCSECGFWKVPTGELVGSDTISTCHTKGPFEAGHVLWPRTAANDFCPHWRPKQILATDLKNYKDQQRTCNNCTKECKGKVARNEHTTAEEYCLRWTDEPIEPERDRTFDIGVNTVV